MAKPTDQIIASGIKVPSDESGSATVIPAGSGQFLSISNERNNPDLRKEAYPASMTATPGYTSNSKLSLLESVKKRSSAIDTRIFFAAIFIYHLLITLQGLDFNDEGFHLAFYQQIFNDPESVQYGFWMWLTGIIGGLYMKMLPFLGAWGIRLAGAMVSTGTAIIAYNLMKKYLHQGYLKLGIILLVLFIHLDAKNLYYNNLSAFFYFLAAFFLFRGLRDQRGWQIALAGFVICLNIFTRIPNILGIGMAITIFYYGYITQKRFKEQLQQLTWLLAGFAAGAGFVFGLMSLLGHTGYFLNSISMVFGSSQEAAGNDGTGGAYGLLRLFTRNADGYLRGLRAVLLVAILFVGFGWMNYLAAQMGNRFRAIARNLNWVLVAGLVALVFTGWFDSYRMLVLYTGIGLIPLFIIFKKDNNPNLRLLSLMGVLILLIHPFGSSEGISTVAVYSLWIVFPLAIHTLSSTSFLDFTTKITTGKNRYTFRIAYTGAYQKAAMTVAFVVIGMACLYRVVVFPYLCDTHSRLEMTHSIDNKFMRGIYTSEARAGKITELLGASSGYIKPNDIVLAFDCMPLYHFVTETRSYVRNPCIWFYSSSLFLTELSAAEKRYKELPPVVRQLILTTGEGSGWPEKTPKEQYSLLGRNQDKNKYLDDFLNRHHYTRVWTNGAFEILMPAINPVDNKSGVNP